MGLDFDALLAEQDATLAAAGVSWLGSGDQLQFLTGVVHSVPGLADVNVAWAPHTGAAYWEFVSRTITVERIDSVLGLEPEDVAKLVLLGVIHEILHARFSTPATAYRTRLATIRHRGVAAIERLFNMLEDGRITTLGKAAEPALAPGLDEHLGFAVDQARQLQRANAEGTAPADPRQQLYFALVVYAMTSEIPRPLHPDVTVEFSRLQPTIDATRGGTTNDCGIAAIELFEANMRFGPSS